MEVKKAIKRIFAVATATGLVGATLAGALAYDLATYPAPFVNNGVLSPADSVIVVGANAKTQDVVGAIEIGASLQAAATTVTPLQVPGVVVDPTVTEGVKIQRSGNKMNYGKVVADVKESLDNEDLPTMLKDGTFDKDDYTQKLSFGATTGEFNYFSPGRVDKTEFDGGDYMYFPDNAEVYTYTLTFDSPHSFSYTDATDNSLVSKTITIQGQDYTVTSVKDNAAGRVTEMELLAGESTKWLQQDQPLTVGDHTVMVVNVDENGDKCGIEVDGTVKWVDKGATETFGTLEVGVTDAIPVHSKDGGQDTCEINVGAHKLTLKDGGKVKFNDVELDGAVATVNASTDTGEWDSLSVKYSNKKDDFETDQYGPAQYVGIKKAWSDPVFGNFKIMFEGVSGNFEDLSVESAGSDATFTFQNVDAKDVEVPWTVVDGSLHLGDADTTFWCVESCNVTLATYPDAYLWYVISAGSGNGELHVLHFDEYDDTTSKITFNDETYGNDITTDTIADDGAFHTVGIGTLGDITLSYDGSVLGFDPAGQPTATTRYGAQVSVANATTAVTVVSPNDDSDVQSADETLTFDLTVNADDDFEVGTPTTDGTFVASNENVKYKDTDVKEYVTEKGIKIEYDATTDHTYAKISYPEADAYANVFVAPLAAEAAGGSVSGGAFNAEKVNKIPVGLAVLDTDAQSMTKNMIVVGGPCINLVANEIEAPTGECFAGYESGKAKIKSYTRKGKVALLVAGMDAPDTLGASYVLRDYEDYAGKLKGSEVQVVVASLSDISVTSASTTPSTGNSSE